MQREDFLPFFESGWIEHRKKHKGTEQRIMKAITPKALLKDLRELITEARQDVARQVNSALVLLYWRIGKRIRQDILKEKRAEYGEQIVRDTVDDN